MVFTATAQSLANWSPPRAARKSTFKSRTIAARAHAHPHLEWVVSAKPLSNDVCDALVELGRSFPAEQPIVVGQEQLTNHRVGYVHMLPCVPRTNAVYQLLWDAAVDATTRHYGLALRGITRMPHYVEYHGGHGHFHWHNDYSHESVESPRKLTVIIQLSDAAEYEGGDLQVFDAIPTPLPRQRGSVICLPSFVPHRVTAVTAGIRRVIVAWIAGPRLS
jgi:PKHD-type hydroxylase